MKNTIKLALVLFVTAFLVSCKTTNNLSGAASGHLTALVHKAKPLAVTNPLCYQSQCPAGSPDTNFVVDHDIFVLSSNRDTKFSDWVAYQVTKDNIDGPTHSRTWRQDPEIPADYILSPADYKDASATYDYDRGHQVPLVGFSNNPNWAKT